MKLSWQELHLRLTPRKTCAVFCAACSAGVWLALTVPRRGAPLRPETWPAALSGARREVEDAVHAVDPEGIPPYRRYHEPERLTVPPWAATRKGPTLRRCHAMPISSSPTTPWC